MRSISIRNPHALLLGPPYVVEQHGFENRIAASLGEADDNVFDIYSRQRRRVSAAQRWA